MKISDRVKNFFSRKGSGYSGEKKMPRTMREKRRDIGNAVRTFLLIFIGLVMLSETTLAIVNLFFWQNKNASSFVIPIAIMPTVALLITAVIIYVNNETDKLVNRFISAFDKVSEGKFGYQLEVPAKGQFKTLFENFNKMSKELASIQTLKDEFIHDFSHEFKTPIASINGFANLLLEGGASDEEQRQYLKIIADESARLSTLAESTLMLNRLENQQFVGEMKLYRLDLQIKDCIILLESSWSKKNIAINSSLARTEYTGNASLMQQVWLNLLTNAIKFTPENGEIDVELAENDGTLRVSVTDNGIGMSEEVAAHVFDKYYKGDSSRSTAGNGLGLAIVKRIVTMCGGEVSVSSRQGEGSTFTVVLPLNNI